VVHIEAGLRSFNKQMPEEINRILCDHVSTLLFTPTVSGMKNLLNEGFKTEYPAGTKIDADHPQIYHSGDVMYDNSLYFAELAESKNILKNLELSKGDFLLATIHRDYNTDHKERLSAIFDALDRIARSENKAIVLPLHPRTAKLLETNLHANVLSLLRSNPLLKIIPPVSFLEMIALEKHASVILTDSGGVQKEAFFFQRPCIILRSETEWVELVENGNAIITDADTERILKAYNHFKEHTKLAFPAFYGDGRAADFICGEMIRHFAK
jgi:UDP-GlcNAc3NAcA epimerase